MTFAIGTSTCYPFRAESDTLVYHDYFQDPTQPTYILNGLSEYWVSVRFTPEREFTASSVHFLIENITGSTEPCYIFLALDSNGQPDPDSILAGPITVNGPLPNLQMITIELPGGIVIDSLRDFHVMISSGGTSSYSVALELPADFPERTGYTPNSHVGPFSPYQFPTMADAIIAVEGYYPSMPHDHYDIEAGCLSNGIDLFFPDALAIMGLTFWSEVTNNGPDSCPEYTIAWMVLDDADSLVFQYDTLQPPLASGEMVNVPCPLQWITMKGGDYVIKDSVFVEGETDSTNNTSYLEQRVQISRQLSLKYCDTEPEDKYLIQGGTSYAVRFVPWSRVAAIDSLALYFTEESSCRISVHDGYYSDELPGEVLFTSEDLVFPEGWSVYHFEDLVFPTRSTFFIVLTGLTDSAHLGLDSDPPLTSHTCLPEQFFKSAESSYTWTPIITDDPMMEIFVTKRSHPAEKYVEVLACGVEPDSVQPGQSIKVTTQWEYFNIIDDEPLVFWIISGLAAYPSMIPMAIDSLKHQDVLTGLHTDTTYFLIPENTPGGVRGISGALVTSSSTQALQHSLLGDIFYILHRHHVVNDSL